MTGIVRTGVDAAGGTELGKSPDVYANNAAVVRKGDPVAGHGRAPHARPVMVGASSDVYANGILVCRAGDLASCGHPASGSGDVIVN
jgi:uncharacterized Zn-binding protein involved in type VI secretion